MKYWDDFYFEYKVLLHRNYQSLIEFSVAAALFSSVALLGVRSIEKVFSKNNQIQCSFHQRSIFQVTMLYSSDFGDCLPHEDTGGSKPPYDACWTQVLDIVPYEMGFERLSSGYNLKMNSRLEDYKGNKSYFSDPFLYLPRAITPANTPYLFDGRVDGWYKNKMYGGPTSVDPRHDLESNFIFLDGSGRSLWEIPHPKGGWSGHGNLQWDSELSIENQKF